MIPGVKVGTSDYCEKCGHPIIFTFRLVWEHVYQWCEWDESGRLEYGQCGHNIGYDNCHHNCGCGLATPPPALTFKQSRVEEFLD